MLLLQSDMWAKRDYAWNTACCVPSTHQIMKLIWILWCYNLTSTKLKCQSGGKELHNSHPNAGRCHTLHDLHCDSNVGLVPPAAPVPWVEARHLLHPEDDVAESMDFPGCGKPSPANSMPSRNEQRTQQLAVTTSFTLHASSKQWGGHGRIGRTSAAARFWYIWSMLVPAYRQTSGLEQHACIKELFSLVHLCVASLGKIIAAA